VSFVLGTRSAVASRHLGAMLSAYADRSLPAATLLACDRHVSICPGCRDAAEAERRLLRSLRSDATPELPSGLESALLCLAFYAEPSAPTRPPSPLVVVGRSAPAMHRSPVRAALLASLAAGASAAAAWSVGVSGVSPSGASLSDVRLTSPAAVASSSNGAGMSGDAVSFLTNNLAVERLAGSIELGTALTTVSADAVPVAGPSSGVRNQPEFGRADP
jgi:anti-sigma factor RsiW